MTPRNLFLTKITFALSLGIPVRSTYGKFRWVLRVVETSPLSCKPISKPPIFSSPPPFNTPNNHFLINKVWKIPEEEKSLELWEGLEGTRTERSSLLLPQIGGAEMESGCKSATKIPGGRHGRFYGVVPECGFPGVSGGGDSCGGLPVRVVGGYWCCGDSRKEKKIGWEATGVSLLCYWWCNFYLRRREEKNREGRKEKDEEVTTRRNLDLPASTAAIKEEKKKRTRT